jgi:hypothetical protein
MTVLAMASSNLTDRQAVSRQAKVRSSEAVGLQAGGPGPWRGGHGHSNTVLSLRLVNAVWFASCKDARIVASWQRHKHGRRGPCWYPLPGND